MDFHAVGWSGGFHNSDISQYQPWVLVLTTCTRQERTWVQDNLHKAGADDPPPSDDGPPFWIYLHEAGAEAVRCYHMITWSKHHAIIWWYDPVIIWSYDHMIVWSMHHTIIWSYDTLDPYDHMNICSYDHTNTWYQIIWTCVHMFICSYVHMFICSYVSWPSPGSRLYHMITWSYDRMIVWSPQIWSYDHMIISYDYIIMWSHGHMTIWSYDWSHDAIIWSYDLIRSHFGSNAFLVPLKIHPWSPYCETIVSLRLLFHKMFSPRFAFT